MTWIMGHTMNSLSDLLIEAFEHLDCVTMTSTSKYVLYFYKSKRMRKKKKQQIGTDKKKTTEKCTHALTLHSYHMQMQMQMQYRIQLLDW